MTRKHIGVTVRHEKARITMVDEREQAADRVRHDRHTARTCLKRNEPEALGPTGHEHDVGSPVIGRQNVVLLRRYEQHLLRHTEFLDEVRDAVDLTIARRTARTPDRNDSCTGEPVSGTLWHATDVARFTS